MRWMFWFLPLLLAGALAAAPPPEPPAEQDAGPSAEAPVEPSVDLPADGIPVVTLGVYHAESGYDALEQWVGGYTAGEAGQLWIIQRAYGRSKDVYLLLDYPGGDQPYTLTLSYGAADAPAEKLFISRQLIRGSFGYQLAPDTELPAQLGTIYPQAPIPKALSAQDRELTPEQQREILGRLLPYDDTLNTAFRVEHTGSMALFDREYDQYTVWTRPEATLPDGTIRQFEMPGLYLIDRDGEILLRSFGMGGIYLPIFDSGEVILTPPADAPPEK